MGPGGEKCTMSCTPTTGSAMSTDCPSGFVCEMAGTGGACWPASHDGGGCCDASGAGAPTALFGFTLVGLLLGRRRRSS